MRLGKAFSCDGCGAHLYLPATDAVARGWIALSLNWNGALTIMHACPDCTEAKIRAQLESVTT